MTIPIAKRSDSLVGRGSVRLNLFGSRSSGLIHRRLPPEVNGTRETVETVLLSAHGSILAIVEIPKSAMHAWKFLIYMFALGNGESVRQLDLIEGGKVLLLGFRGQRGACACTIAHQQPLPTNPVEEVGRGFVTSEKPQLTSSIRFTSRCSLSLRY